MGVQFALSCFLTLLAAAYAAPASIPTQSESPVISEVEIGYSAGMVVVLKQNSFAQITATRETRSVIPTSSGAQTVSGTDIFATVDIAGINVGILHPIQEEKQPQKKPVRGSWDSKLNFEYLFQTVSNADLPADVRETELLVGQISADQWYLKKPGP
ncbi:hypothetical protein R3P38DRAFT_2771728 [Favolaschia claudopus]|uniref:Uncharacterized protein n=1 Tax=Favolaschia claudopus TaxID=2862362 RepID=A0AAW0CEY5_9AGAR